MRTRRSREQWSAVIEELGTSGESVEGFCRRRGIRARTLSWWKWKLASAPRRSSPAAAIRLLRVAVSPEASRAVACGVAIEVADVRVHVEVGTDVAYVGALVESLRRRC
jgi:transposase-like protein